MCFLKFDAEFLKAEIVRTSGRHNQHAQVNAATVSSNISDIFQRYDQGGCSAMTSVGKTLL